VNTTSALMANGTHATRRKATREQTPPTQQTGYGGCPGARDTPGTGGRPMSRARTPSLRGGRCTTASHQSRSRSVAVLLDGTTRDPRCQSKICHVTWARGCRRIGQRPDQRHPTATPTQHGTEYLFARDPRHPEFHQLWALPAAPRATYPSHRGHERELWVRSRKKPANQPSLSAPGFAAKVDPTQTNHARRQLWARS
jgi:hypothetical protein